MTITVTNESAFFSFLTLNNYSKSTLNIAKDALDCLKKFSNTGKLEDYRMYLTSRFSPATTNLYIYVANKYLNYSGIDYKIKSVPNHNSKVLEKVISVRDYKKLRDFLKDKNPEMYLVVITLACTGMRPSELYKINVSDVNRGYADIYSKRNKQRRIYFPKSLQKEILNYKAGVKGKIFTFKMYQLRYALELGTKLGIDKEVLHPYSFRHFFGKNFLKNNKDLTLLADLMGHESLETTRIYTRLTKEEQMREVNKCVNWM